MIPAENGMLRIALEKTDLVLPHPDSRTALMGRQQLCKKRD